jgi:hypothetical protein
MSLPTAHRRDERGALSTAAAAAAALIILVALVYYVVSGGPGGSSSTVGSPAPSQTVPTSPTAAPATTTGPTQSTSPTQPTQSATRTARPTPTPIDRSGYRVGVYNNTSISGLAHDAAAKVRKLGWNVIAVTNWSGVIPTSTVYFQPGDRAAARLLATDLGLDRIHKATATMPKRSLTLILTGPLP